MLAPGTKLGSYEVVAQIGAGGMGEVYRAHDTRLDRIVAIKVLPAHLAGKPELRERFEREARTIASLNHPHICVIHDVGRQDGMDFLVMEYLEGETLAARVLKGPLPLDQVLQYAIEIADALDKAHRKGVTHRDLKPGNVMLTKSGTKLLDFGLAKLKQETAPVNLSLSKLPTAGPAITAQGVILGTLQYMAPEQVEGKTDQIDARTDIFAFGTVVYEMATGKKAFEGGTSASVMAKILEVDAPPMSSLQPMTPPALDRVVRRCLAKDKEERWQSAFDLWHELRWIAAGGAEAAMPSAVAGPKSLLSKASAAWSVAAVCLLAMLGLALAHFRTAEEPRVLKMSLLPPEKAVFNALSIPALSPDGHHLAFVADVAGKDSLWVRDLDSLSARSLPGTDSAIEPFWSPDSRFIGFFAGGKLKKIDVAGGPAVSLCDVAGQGYGGSWSKNDAIVFSPNNNGGLFLVSAAGGSATPLTTPDQASGEITHRLPWFLPDGRHFLYTATDFNKSAVYVADMDSKTRHEVPNVASNAVFVAPGYLLFVRDRTLMAQPFDADKAQATGNAVPVAEQVDLSGGVTGQAQFSASQNGVLTYVSGGAGGIVQLTWFDRSGKALGTLGPPGDLQWPEISPDGTKVVVDRRDPGTGFPDLWLHDLTRGTASRLTFNSKANEYPIWSPDGSHIVFSSSRDGGRNLYQKAVSGNAKEEALDKAPLLKKPVDWSKDGRYIIEETTGAPKTGFDIWVLPLFGDRKPFPYLQTEFVERWAKLSPNGQWLAYRSNETLRNEVYVQTFPTPGGKWQVSTNGGDRPIWSRDGKEIFFVAADQKMMAVEVKGDNAKGGASFQAGVPKPLFDTGLLSNAFTWFDVSKDGRFLIPTPPEQSVNVAVTVVVNWTAGLKK